MVSSSEAGGFMTTEAPHQPNALSPLALKRAVETLPPLPAVAMRVMEVAQNPKSSAADLARVVSADPALSARVLRVANSAAYSRSRVVTSIQEALVVLGFTQARNVAISSAVAGAYAPDALHILFRLDAFWRHSIAVAFKSSEIAEQMRGAGAPDAPSAFTTGILHNIGWLALFHADPAGVDQTVAESIRSNLPMEQIEREQLGYDHASLGAALARQWQLPALIIEAIAHHHDDEPQTGSLAAVIAQADRYCQANGVYPGFFVPPALATKRRPGPEMKRLLDQVDSLIDMILGRPIVELKRQPALV